MKKRDFMFNGKSFEIGTGVTERLHERLNQTLPGYATLESFRINKFDNSLIVYSEPDSVQFTYKF